VILAIYGDLPIITYMIAPSDVGEKHLKKENSTVVLCPQMQEALMRPSALSESHQTVIPVNALPHSSCTFYLIL